MIDSLACRAGPYLQKTIPSASKDAGSLQSGCLARSAMAGAERNNECCTKVVIGHRPPGIGGPLLWLMLCPGALCGVFVGSRRHCAFQNIGVTMIYLLCIPQDMWR